MNEPAGPTVQLVVFAAPNVVPGQVLIGHPIHTVAELQQQIHEDLRTQHPEWIDPSGESPMCDLYEARLNQLLHISTDSAPDTIDVNVRGSASELLERQFVSV